MRWNLHNVELRPCKNSEGKTIPGLWAAEIVRFERVGQLWECQVPMREIGRSGYFEFRPVSIGGKWMTIGMYRNRNGGCIAAERFQAGTHVLCGGHIFEGEQMPRTVVEWTRELADEITRRNAT